MTSKERDVGIEVLGSGEPGTRDKRNARIVVCENCGKRGKINLSLVEYQGFEEVEPGIWLCDRCADEIIG